MTHPTLDRISSAPRSAAAMAAYASLFAVALPVALVAWATRLDGILDLPAVGSPALGAALATGGALLFAAGTRDLWVHGGGLPMSPFPPRRLVRRGVYRFVSDPLYIGAVLITAGISLAARSPGGLWIVTPVLAAAAAAFVVGFERDATRRRHGVVARPLLRLPEADDHPPSGWERAAIYLLVFLPWAVAYQAVELLGAPSDAWSAYLEWDRALPVVPWTEPVYLLTYPFVLLAPLAASRRATLRRFALEGLWATALIVPFYLLVPVVAPAKEVVGEGFWPAVMRWERAHDSAITAFPAFHVVWTGLAARLYDARWPRLRWVWVAAVLAVAVACVTVGMHAVLDVLAAGVALLVVVRRRAIWRAACDVAQRVADSWREWPIGPVRFLSHGIWAAVGAVFGLAVAVAVLGSEYLGWLVGMTLASIVGAGLWAQLVEGSPQLLRPFGYFGSVFGVLAVAIAAGHEGWLVLAGFGVGAAFTQAIGRGRCLVQGCCHGREAPPEIAIVYTHPRTRPVRLADLSGVPIHPAQLYSMAWLLFVGFVLLRLWTIAAPLGVIVGAYFILTGLGRFVEEGYRGEPQTAVFAGLRLYQWLAIAFVGGGGAAATAFGTTPAPPMPGFDVGTLPILLALGVFSYLAYGVELPGSTHRFSRLT